MKEYMEKMMKRADQGLAFMLQYEKLHGMKTVLFVSLTGGSIREKSNL